MVSHMKTTVDIAQPLLEAAKSRAARERRTLKDVVEEALRLFLGIGKAPRPKFTLRRCSFNGRGLRPGVAEGRWEQVRDLIYPV